MSRERTLTLPEQRELLRKYIAWLDRFSLDCGREKRHVEQYFSLLAAVLAEIRDNEIYRLVCPSFKEFLRSLIHHFHRNSRFLSEIIRTREALSSQLSDYDMCLLGFQRSKELLPVVYAGLSVNTSIPGDGRALLGYASTVGPATLRKQVNRVLEGHWRRMGSPAPRSTPPIIDEKL